MGHQGRLTLETASDDHSVIVRVRDTGPGLRPEHHARLFEPFFTTKENGTGLGLAITRRIVEDHGGRIAVESRLGEGTVFELRFPVAGRL
jgi:two-component system sensor histidine kinase AtoS